jgi:hypothetical protein
MSPTTAAAACPVAIAFATDGTWTLTSAAA